MKEPGHVVLSGDRQDADRMLQYELGKAGHLSGDGVRRPVNSTVRARIQRATKHPAQAMNSYAVY